MNINNLALAGGIFSILVFIHFIMDWIFQSHKNAVIKHNSPLIRAEHCSIYTIGFVPILIPMQFELWEFGAACIILFLSHFYLDTYHLVYLWAKHIRKPPEMFELGKYKTCKGGQVIDYPANNKEGFEIFATIPNNRILVIVIDQLAHIMFLIPLVWMALN
jgi:hypothetical protein